MLKREKTIISALQKGTPIYKIPEVGVFRTSKPSKTEPGQALSIQARVKLAEAGIGSLGVTDDMFDFAPGIEIFEALQRENESDTINESDLAKMTLSELYLARMDIINRARLRAEADAEPVHMQPIAPEPAASADPDAE